MEIYKRGQGFWARGFAILLFILFGGWGVWVIYTLPRDMNILVKPGDVLWPETIRRLVRAEVQTVRVKGLANQRVSRDLLQPGLRPARRLEDAAGHGIVLETEDLDEEKLKALEEVPIRFVPVANAGAENALLDSVEITEWLIGRRLAEDVRDMDVKVFAETARDKVLDEPLAKKIRDDLKDHPEARVGPLWKTAAAQEAKEQPVSVSAAEVAAGLICADRIQVPVSRKVADSGAEITREIYDALKALEAKGKMRRVRIADEGILKLDANRADEIGSRFLVAEDSKAAETFWNRSLVQAMGLRLTPGVLIGLAMLLAVVGVSLWSWNLQRWNDLLIETQTEMRKVSWPKRSELFGSSAIVILTVVVMGLFLYVVDFLLTAMAVKAGLLR
ncbi:MAG: preprotein translocase subunit SecE [Planctomycetes bacterium]|nr:preprotein translocase subunit SecE [Planctomycetota bacterium]